jgi:UDP:flavonoid glycosyltransferase YjiC (YdhE family)
MKIILASTPVAGHVNPLLAAARILLAAGHEVVVTTGSVFRHKVEVTGARFHALAEGADLDVSDMDATFPERKTFAPGPAQLRFDFENLFVNTIPAQFATLETILETFPADLILTDTLFAGVMPFLLGARAQRPAIAAMGITCLPLHRDDGAPMWLGLPQPTSEEELARYRDIAKQVDEGFNAPINALANGTLSRLGAAPRRCRCRSPRRC